MSVMKYFQSRTNLLLFIAQLLSTQARSLQEINLPEINGNIFYYFGYGSNLLSDRIHIQNPTAQRVDWGLLKEYRLDFNIEGSRWKGAVATIVPTQGSNVYGAVWQIDLSNLADIDDQEGVNLGIYESLSVPIELANSTVIYARTYRLMKEPSTDMKKLDWAQIPEERLPSKTYLQCIVKGAIETGLPTTYVDWLRSFKHNGRTAVEFEKKLGLKDVKLGI